MNTERDTEDGFCHHCGIWLDDLERATTPTNICFGCSK